MTNAAVVDRPVGRIKPSYGYYRQPNGWVTVSPAADLDELKYQRRGWTRLRQYGLIEMTTPYAANNPLEALFMLGGAHELPVAQVIEMGLHLNPPMVPVCGQMLGQYHKAHRSACFSGSSPVVFPQMAGVQADPWPCRFCDRVSPTEQGRTNHETVAHKDERVELRSGEALASSMIKGLAGLVVGGGVASQPETDVPDEPSASSVLEVLASVGLNQKQIKALAEAGITIEEVGDGEGNE